MADAIAIKSLDIDWSDLEIAYRDSATGIETYLDMYSGEIVPIFNPTDPEKGFVDRYPERFLSIPGYRTADALAVLQAFVAQLEQGSLRERLCAAVEGPGALERCGAIMKTSTQLLDAFYRYEERAIFERLLLWLGALGICPVQPPPFSVRLPLVGLTSRVAA